MTKVFEPAFPAVYHHGNGQIESWVGMTIRDYIAIKAMPVLLKDFINTDSYSDFDWRDGIAIDAYKMADAMLEARER